MQPDEVAYTYTGVMHCKRPAAGTLYYVALRRILLGPPPCGQFFFVEPASLLHIGLQAFDKLSNINNAGSVLFDFRSAGSSFLLLHLVAGADPLNRYAGFL